MFSIHFAFVYKEVFRIQIQTPNLNSTKIDELKQEIQKLLVPIKTITFTLAGSSIYFHALSEEVLFTQVVSILLHTSDYWLVFLGSIRLEIGQFGSFPSIFPLLVVILENSAKFLKSFSVFSFKSKSTIPVPLSSSSAKRKS